jgi:chorismate dehydratase
MKRVRLGAVGYLNARPLVHGLDRSPRFDLRFDVPSRCAVLLHANEIDVGLIPSIEYLRNPAGLYAIVPGLAIASRGPVASVSLYAKKPMNEVRSIAIDSSSRASVALVHVLCAREFRIKPAIELRDPDVASMLTACDAALVIGDHALFEENVSAEKIDLGEVWTKMTGLPFVYAFWAGRSGVLTGDDIAALRQAKEAGVASSEEISREYFKDAPERQPVGAKYLRDNIRYELHDEERAGLELFFRYAHEAGLVPARGALRFY